MKALYTVERWPHGWLICGANGSVPIHALDECAPLFPENSVMDFAISHYYRATGDRHVVVCLTTPEEGKLWRSEIEARLALILHPQQRWWSGLDVGASAVAIFAVLCDDYWKYLTVPDPSWRPLGSVPHDPADFGRCRRLLALFPEWRARLGEVATAHPDTKWPALVARWTELEALGDAALRKELNSL